MLSHVQGLNPVPNIFNYRGISMDLDLDAGWKISAVSGNTGSAYMGTRASQKIFLKRNTSPFLVALSAEGITPKLIWTKRIANGDVLIAQDWINGRTLTATEMTSDRVIQLLRRIHNSVILREILQQIDGRVLQPRQMLNDYLCDLPVALQANHFLNHVVNSLKNNMPHLTPEWVTVTHGDLNHNNWLLADSQRLYLVDWDQAILADPLYDVSFILVNYVPQTDWQQWLLAYGLTWDEQVALRIKWYGELILLDIIKEQYQHQRFTTMNQCILRLQKIIDK